MRVFVTGATGFVGSAVVQELINAGHQVLGLARSQEAAKKLIEAGAQVHMGDLENTDSLRSGAAMSDGVIHTGFIHDFSRFKEMCETDGRVIETLGEALMGSDRPLIITSGIGILNTPDRLATEQDEPLASSPNPRIASEFAAAVQAANGVRVAIVRLPPTVHGEDDHGFVPMLIQIARDKGISVYREAGNNKWPAVHLLDAATLYRLALEKAPAGLTRYHAAAEEGIAFHDIADAISNGLNIPVVSKSQEQAAEHFSWFAHFAAMDCAASAQQTRAELGWQPVQPGLMEDLSKGDYFKITA